VWKTVPRPVQQKVVQVLVAMTESLLQFDKEENDD
jgi:hypothetical protein